MKNELIKCPHCGAEYVPAEIFLPEDFMIEPSSIIRDEKGIIVSWSGIRDDSDSKEEFTCDYCNKSFIAEAKVDFKITKIIDDFDEEYSSNIKK